MDNIEIYLTEAEVEMGKYLEHENNARNYGRFGFHEQTLGERCSAVSHILKANHYQNQAIIELLKERETTEAFPKKLKK